MGRSGAWREENVFYVRGEGIPCIVEMPKNVNEARGTPDQQMAKHERGNSTQGATHWLKVHNWDI